MASYEFHTLNRILSSSSKLIIPDFQRKFSWGDDLIKRFIDTIFDDYIDCKREMYLGDIQLRLNEDKSISEVIDGQQRLTTLYLLLMYMHNEAKWRHKAQPSGVSQITECLYSSESDIDKTGNQISVFKKFLSNKYSVHEAHLSEIFKKYVNFSGGDTTKIPTMTVKEIKKKELTSPNQYEVGLQYVKYYFDLRSTELIAKEGGLPFFMDLGKFISGKISFSVIYESDMNKALTIFTRKNMSGKPLSKVENLKVILMSKIRCEEIKNRFAKEWNDVFYKFNNSTSAGKSRSNQVDNHSSNLILWTLSTFKVKLKGCDSYKIRYFDGDIFNYLIDTIVWDNDSDIIELIETLAANVDVMEEILTNSRSTILRSLTKNGYTWYPLMICGFNTFKTDVEREKVYKIAEHIITYMIIKNKSLGGSHEVKDTMKYIIKDLFLTGKTIDDCYSEVIKTYDLDSLKDKFSTLTYSLSKEEDGTGNSKLIVKHILLYLEAIIQAENDGDRSKLHEIYKNLLSEKKNLEVEHILPRGDEEYKINKNDYNSLGNLTILEKRLNGSAGKKEFLLKKPLYTGSKFHLTKLLTGDRHLPQTFVNKYINKYKLNTIGEKDTFNLDDVKDRTNVLVDMFIATTIQ